MRPVLTAMLCTVLLAGGAAQAGNGGTQSPFSLGAGARALGMGSADLVYCDPSVAAYWNPAGLALTERYSLEAFHSGLYDSEAGYQYFGFAVPTMDFGNFGAGIFRLGIDGIEKRDASNVYLGTMSDSRLGLYLGYGRDVSEYELGVAITVEQHSPDVYSATSSPGITLSAGRRFDLGGGRLEEIGATVIGRNLVRPSIKVDEESVTYPYSIDAGVSLRVLPAATEEHRIVVSGRLTKVENLAARMAFGVEYNLLDYVDLRAGIADGGPSFGFGLFYKYVGFDYAMAKRDLGTLHMFSISGGFGLPVSEKRRIREENREAEFNHLLGERFAESNRSMVADLVSQGEHAAAAGDLGQAVVLFERALFIAAGAGMNTVRISALAAETQMELEQEKSVRAYAANMHEARKRFDSGDYLGARYFADLALTNRPGSEDASALLERADAAFEESVSRDQEIERGLMLADSLMSYGEVEEALVVARSLKRVAPDDGRVQLALRKAEFTSWQSAAEEAFSRGDSRGAQTALDSAAVRFPDHPWCANLRGRLAAYSDHGQAAVDKPRRASRVRVEDLSPEMLKEVAATYKRGQDLFEQGRLSEAVAEWERVEALAPGYMSVSEYLVDAYKFLGVELYTRNELSEAVDVWKKAARLAPDSTEIANYIKRTEHEIAKLQEMSYDRR